MLLSRVWLRSLVQRVVWFLVPVAAVVCARAQAERYAGTMPEDYLPGLRPILESALKQSPRMILRQIDISRSEARVIEADHERWPNIGGDIRYDSNRTAATSSAPSRDSGLFYSVSLNQSILRWGEVKHAGEIARLEVAVSQKDYAEGYRILAGEIRHLYLELVVYNAQLKHARFDAGMRAADLASAKEKLAHGTASPTEIAAKQLLYDEYQLSVDKMQAMAEGEARKLARLAGLPAVSLEQVPAEIPEIRYSDALASQLLAEFLRDGGRTTFRAQVNEMKAREADLNYRIARVRLLPKFDASIGTNRSTSTTATATQVNQTAITQETIELRGRWTMFDGFSTKAAKMTALIDKRYYQRQQQIEADAAMDEAQRLNRTVGIDARAMDLTEQHRLGYAAGIDRVSAEVKAGTVSENDLNGVKRDLRYAEYNNAMSRATFLDDWGDFVSLVADDPMLKLLPPAYVRPKR